MRRALLVGVNRYKYGFRLRGCLEDVRAWWEVLKSLGWSAREIRILTDERATSDRIADALSWLASGKLKSGDAVFFFFSGFSCCVRDLEGDGLAKESEEVLCPHDFDWEGRWISSELLKLVFFELPKGVTLEIVLDTNPSGKAGRGITYTARTLSPPLDIVSRWEPVDCQRFEDLGKGAVWVASKEGKGAHEVRCGLRHIGAFSRAMTSVLRSAPKLPREELLRQVSLRLPRQQPTLTLPASMRSRPFLA